MTTFKSPIIPGIKIEVMSDSMLVFVDGDMIGDFDADEFDRIAARMETSIEPKADTQEFFEEVLTPRPTVRQAELVTVLFMQCADEINHNIHR